MSLNICDIVNYSVDFIYRLFSKDGSALHEDIIGLESSLIQHFSLPDTINSMRLFKPAYWALIENYVLSGLFPNGNGNPSSSSHLWRLKVGGLPDKETYKRRVMEKYGRYLEQNLKLALQSSS